MSAPAVSVIVCTFNRLHLLPRALASVAAQTFDDVEVVVVNDGGSDPSPVVERFRSQLEMTVVNQPVNRGVTAAHNAGLAAARGRWIAWLDDDDRFLPQHLETLVGRADDGRVVPYTDGVRVLEDPQGRPLEREVLPVPAEFDRDHLLVENYIPALGPLVPRALMGELGGFDERLPVLEDWEMWIRVSEALPFVHVPEVTYEYRVRGGRANLTTRAAFRFHTALEDVYRKHPVSAESWMADGRARLIEASAPRLDERVVDTSIVVRAPDDVASLVKMLKAVAAEMKDRSFEVVVLAGRSTETEALAARITGPVTFVLDYDADDPMASGRLQAVGRDVRLVGSADDPTTDPYLPRAVIVGTGRSGTGFIARALRSAGVAAGHEQWWNPHGIRDLGLEVDASWLAVPELAGFDGPVWWQVRDPLRVVSSLIHGDSVIGLDGNPYWEVQRRHVPFEGGALRWAVRFTADWLRRCEAHADRVWRLEDIDGDLIADLAADLGHEVQDPDGVLDALPRRVNRHVPADAPGLTWDDLPAGDPDAAYLRSVAHRFGYRSEPSRQVALASD